MSGPNLELGMRFERVLDFVVDELTGGNPPVVAHDYRLLKQRNEVWINRGVVYLFTGKRRASTARSEPCSTPAPRASSLGSPARDSAKARAFAPSSCGRSTSPHGRETTPNAPPPTAPSPTSARRPTTRSIRPPAASS